MSAVVTIALIIVAFALVPAVTGTTRTRGFFEVAAWNLLGVAVARLLLRGWSSPLADQDSLFTLGTAEILGLAALSTFLIAGSCLLIFRISCAWAATPASHFPRAVALVAAPAASNVIKCSPIVSLIIRLVSCRASGALFAHCWASS